ncbi:tRNA dimethylallyltransferase [compost metagenome]
MIRAIEIAEYLNREAFLPEERPALAPVVIGLSSDVTLRRERIYRRLKARLEGGMVAEVQGLLDLGVSREILEFYGLEYKFLVSYLFKELSYQEMEEKLGTAICQFAKRQMTFFRKMEKDGVKIHWFDADTKNDELIDSVISLYQEGFSV